MAMGKPGSGDFLKRSAAGAAGPAVSAGGQDGFTLIELLVTIVISLFVIAATTTLFGQLFAQFKQESRVSQTDIGDTLGLEYMQKDIQSAGYALPWDVTGVNPYPESAVANAVTDDIPPDAPRAIFSLPGATFNDPDYLVIKSELAAVNDSAEGKSTMLNSSGPIPWGDPNENLINSDNVIVESAINNNVSLVNVGGAFSALYKDVTSLAPTNGADTYMIYGVANAADAPGGLRMPYNRADYFVTQTDAPVPSRCAPGTGELVKAVMSQKDGTYVYYPILDCVGNMKVEFYLYDSATDTYSYSNDISAKGTYPAFRIRQQLREVLVYILAQEGQKDPSYTSPAQIPMYDPYYSGNFTISNSQLNYRWKIYTIIEKPMNLGQ